ncbi:MAG: MFS transporter [Lentihominibacter sp.]|jgi:GPH family glycoside/pentoside/hexuronide:cation symporter
MDINNNASVTASDEKLKPLEKYGYGLGDFAFNFVYMGVSLYLTIFYTDVVGIAPIAVSVLFLIARVFDALNDPVMGIIVDHTNTKHGRFRPYLLWFAVPFGISVVLCFTAPPFATYGGSLAYAYVTYILMGVICTILTCPYASLAAAMTQDSVERGELGVIRIIGGQIACLIVSSALPLCVNYFIKTEYGAAGGYLTAMIFCGIIGSVAYFTCFKVTKERYIVKEVKPKLTGPAIKGLVFNKAFLTLFLMIVFMHGYFAVASSGLAYFYTYIFNSLTGLSVFNLVSALATIAGLIIVNMLLRRGWDKKKVALIGSIGCIMCPIYFQFCPATVTAMYIALAIRVVYGFFWAAIQGLVWGLVPDTIEYGELRSGQRAAGLLTSLQSFAYKAGMALAGIIPGIVLSMTGYVPNVEQSEAAIAGIRAINGWIPLILIIGTIVFMAMYPLTRDKYESVLAELREKNASKSTDVE